MDTEEKIKKAAREVFKQKGFAGTRTRDIAAVAGVNPALLNYYFRSKKELFNVVMKDLVMDFANDVRPDIKDKSKGFKESVVEVLNKVTDLYLEEPDLVIFLLTEIREMPEKYIQEMHLGGILNNTVVMDFLNEHFGGEGTAMFNRGGMLVVSIISFVMFPFIGKPILESVVKVGEEEFRNLINERRKMIPAYVDFMVGQYLNQ